MFAVTNYVLSNSRKTPQCLRTHHDHTKVGIILISFTKLFINKVKFLSLSPGGLM